MITDVTGEASCPLQIQISPFVHAQLLFSEVVTAKQLSKKSLFKILADYKVGSMITVYHNAGKFTTTPTPKQFAKGDLLPVRFVKSNPGYGISVQLSEQTFGAIEVCELSDDITHSLVQQLRQKKVFLARVIDTDKKGRLMLSARESLVESWEVVYTGATAVFQKFDEKNQSQGNLRNKIVKFGPKLAVS